MPATYSELLVIYNHLGAFLKTLQAIPGLPLDNQTGQPAMQSTVEYWRRVMPDSPIFFIIEPTE